MYGVGFMIKSTLKKAIEEFLAISERIAILNITLPGHKTPTSILQIYAPTEVASNDIKEKFYKDLKYALDKSHKNIILMGDFNSQLGTRKKNEDNILGPYSTGKRNNNGQRLIDLALEYNLHIMNSVYKKKPNRKWTWISPNGSIRNEIDFILTNKPKWFLDVSVINQLNFNTNHRMLQGKIHSNCPKESRKNIKTGQNHLPQILPENIIRDLETSLENIEQQQSLQEKYNKLEYGLQQINKQISIANKQKDKIGPHARNLINKRKLLLEDRKSNRAAISQLSKQINLNIRKHKKQIQSETFKLHLEQTGGTAKAMKEMQEYSNWIPSMRNRRTKKLETKRKNISKAATQFYKELYDCEDTTLPNLKSLYQLDEEIIPLIEENEVIKAVSTQKNGKATGEDQISNELLKCTLPASLRSIVTLFNEILQKEEIPKQWTTSTIILLHKKGDRNDVGNYRPISLMSNLYKIFSKIILQRIEKVLDENQPKEQAGFRKGFATIDHIHTIKQIIEKSNEYGKKYYLAFIDYSKAFDSLLHSYIWEALKMQNVQNKYIRIISNIYKCITAKIKLETVGEEFKLKKGVRQGDPLSPKLFSATLEQTGKGKEADLTADGKTTLELSLDQHGHGQEEQLTERNGRS
ncbi:uncharacterized protein LOC134801658 [Cydia splendana]|uniref:uncharacterized protein LOC134801658 n=1 Tax=Cydia splendana TaxID=1100963 RepID=UPI00300D938C